MDKKKPRRRRDLFKEPLTEAVTDEHGRTKQTFLKGEVSWREGGANYFSGGTEQRGYELWISPITEEQYEVDGRKFTSTGFMVGGPGLRALIEAAPRFNAKRLAELTVPAEKLEEVKAKVLAGWKEEQARDGR